ncbi:DUF1552 domain-containing protein [Allorhodopirellula heiligendammensis]|uniref:DUF1552 domain-containing protein n=1 Tax=Allorhodopirellula heiligendammensis TaxID=2714739 RepID=A0A5C6BI63_9BACT|nr:DUF1552 domain-containing protein [Allorhodopirellula heiligendammensis]TWU10134.1 hypothetical protein Poly21_51030 [Allorhodopirellula heiligendammensis]|tara:strand:+ start:2066 stop:3469 length:1404 start_codon:yes stop_codon:yes gene_type:complete
MKANLNHIDRRRFLRGSGIALALPLFGSLATSKACANGATDNPKRLGCFYFPDGVPMPLPEDPAYQEWAWFPHGNGSEFEFTKCMEPLEQLKSDLTVLSGFSHINARDVHGHNNADQFLTGAATGGGDREYSNSISLDQEYAKHVGDQTRFASLVMSTDGGTGTARGTHTISFDRNGRPIPAEHRPKQIFDQLFVKSDGDSSRRLAMSRSALDDMLSDARSLRKTLSASDRKNLDEYLDSVRQAEVKVEKAKRWLDAPLPQLDGDPLNLELTTDEPREYLRTMFDLIYLAFKTDSTRVATYQIGRENGVGRSDHLARAVGFNLAHQLSHETKNPGGWKNFGVYCQFLNEEYGRLIAKLKATPEPAGTGSMLDNSLLLFGSASSAFHLSRNYPLILAGGKHMGFKHGQYLNHAGMNFQGGPWLGKREPWQDEAKGEDMPLSNLYVTMLQRLGVTTNAFADSTGIVANV